MIRYRLPLYLHVVRRADDADGGLSTGGNVPDHHCPFIAGNVSHFVIVDREGASADALARLSERENWRKFGASIVLTGRACGGIFSGYVSFEGINKSRLLIRALTVLSGRFRGAL